jgi:hypothetical protein
LDNFAIYFHKLKILFVDFLPNFSGGGNEKVGGGRKG